MKLDETQIKKKLIRAFENHKNNKFQTAEKLYKEILTLSKNHLEANFNLGTLYSQLKKFDLALPLLMKAKELNSNNININLNIGNLFLEKGDFETSLKYFEKIIQIEPKFVLAHFNKGIIFSNQKKHLDAIRCFEKVIDIDPNNFRATNTLLSLISSIQLSNISENNSFDLNELFITLFKKDTIDHNILFNNAKNLIIFEEDKKKIQELIDLDKSLLSHDVVKKALKKELFLLTLQKSLFRDKFLEKFLCYVRKEFLVFLKSKSEKLIVEFLDFIISFAQQSFLNEYLFFQSNDEIKIINELKTKIEKDKNISEIEISILACYLPLNVSKIISNKLVNYSAKNNLFNDLIQIQIKDSLTEEELKKSINSFDTISDNISKKVRNQYEENPYPRWRYTNITPKNNFLSILNNNIYPNKIISNIKNLKRNILIAGCGTGQQLVSKASYDNSDILAVDLSLSSLSFAKRKMQELNHSNIEFLHGDILNLNNLNKKFSVIECVGVLHHLKDPEEGLKVLLNILEPNGYLKLGLYSDYARKHIVEARKLIKKYNLDNNITSIRNFREIIKNEKENKILQKLNYNYDFYSTSNVRDLIFHVQEHRYTIPKILKLLKKHDLEFLGFTNSAIKKEYSKYYPSDLKNTSLENWNEFEIKNPDTFIQMYQFWLKK